MHHMPILFKLLFFTVFRELPLSWNFSRGCEKDKSRLCSRHAKQPISHLLSMQMSSSLDSGPQGLPYSQRSSTAARLPAGCDRSAGRATSQSTSLILHWYQMGYKTLPAASPCIVWQCYKQCCSFTSYPGLALTN